MNSWTVAVVDIYDIISYSFFANVDAGNYPHAASQYHVLPEAKRGIALLSVDKFPYLRKQTRGNEFIPCSKDSINNVLFSLYLTLMTSNVRYGC